MNVSLLVINYNSSGYTLDCVASIRRQTQLSEVEIIVVDNGSRPDDFARLHVLTDVPNLKLLRSRVNLGFSGGHLLGLQVIDPTSAYYFFLNNDCLLLDDVCSRLYEFMEANRSVGACTAQAVNAKDELEPSFNYFPTFGEKVLGQGLMRWFQPAQFPSRHRVYTEPVAVPVLTGSALFVRATAYWDAGGFDPAYFLYCEEEDLCRRLQARQWTTLLVPNTRFRHIGGASTRRNWLVEKEYYLSLFYYFRKYHNGLERLLLQLFYSLKVGRKVLRDREYGRLAWFILRGAPGRESLRYQQRMAIEPDQPSTAKSDTFFLHTL